MYWQPFVFIGMMCFSLIVGFYFGSTFDSDKLIKSIKVMNNKMLKLEYANGKSIYLRLMRGWRIYDWVNDEWQSFSYLDRVTKNNKYPYTSDISSLNNYFTISRSEAIVRIVEDLESTSPDVLAHILNLTSGCTHNIVIVTELNYTQDQCKECIDCGSKR